jgi:hypothetical protein
MGKPKTLHSLISEIDLKSDEIISKDWQEATLTMVFVDRGRVRTREVKVTREEMLADRKPEDAEDSPEVDNRMFQAIILRAASAMFSTPVIVEGENSNELRLISPASVKEVTVTIPNLGKVVLA